MPRSGAGVWGGNLESYLVFACIIYLGFGRLNLGAVVAIKECIDNEA
jgi:hypothetical protein